MKLDARQYFNGNRVRITEQGWIDLRKFCQSVLYKNYGTKFTKEMQEDLVSICLLGCVDNLEKYDASRNDELGGFLYWKVRGEVTKLMQKAVKEISVDMRDSDYIQWIESQQLGEYSHDSFMSKYNITDES